MNRLTAVALGETQTACIAWPARDGKTRVESRVCSRHVVVIIRMGRRQSQENMYRETLYQSIFHTSYPFPCSTLLPHAHPYALALIFAVTIASMNSTA